jgi:hypothetical protein
MKESPRLDRFAFVPPQAKKASPETARQVKEQASEVQEDDWAASGSSKKGKKKTGGPAPSWEAEPDAVEERVQQPVVEEKGSTLRTSTLKKGKKKKGSKGVTWIEPAETQSEV